VVEFEVRGILLDIEGTTSSISFVYDEMFPYIRRELHGYIEQNWGQPDLQSACDAIAVDQKHESFAAWVASRPESQQTPEHARQLLANEVIWLMDNDVKATGLKQLQGHIWKAGFHSGELKAHVYEDTPAALQQWCDAGVDVRIYSSGSIAAQKLFFGHTEAGDLLHHFNGHYDTTTGPKREASSYTAIAAEFNLPPAGILFISDVVEELDAAAQAGMLTALSLRPGNPEQPEHTHPRLSSFLNAIVTLKS